MRRKVGKQSHIRTVQARFPGHARRICKLVEQDEVFCELCGDYGECVAALRRFRNLGETAGERIEQYTELCVALEEELRAGITASENQSQE